MSCGSLPTTKTSLGSSGLSASVKGFQSLRGGAGGPGAKSASGNAALGGWDRVPGTCLVWAVVFTKLVHFLFFHWCQAHDHFTKAPREHCGQP